jgi:hypothetical protein
MAEWWHLDVTHRGFHIEAEVVGDQDRIRNGARDAIDWWIDAGPHAANIESFDAIVFKMWELLSSPAELADLRLVEMDSEKVRTMTEYGTDSNGVPWESAHPTSEEVAARSHDLMNDEGNVIGHGFHIPEVWGRIDPKTGEPFE